MRSRLSAWWTSPERSTYILYNWDSSPRLRKVPRVTRPRVRRQLWVTELSYWDCWAGYGFWRLNFCVPILGVQRKMTKTLGRSIEDMFGLRCALVHVSAFFFFSSFFPFAYSITIFSEGVNGWRSAPRHSFWSDGANQYIRCNSLLMFWLRHKNKL